MPCRMWDECSLVCLLLATMKASDFPHCHPQIASILALERKEDIRCESSGAPYVKKDGDMIIIDFPVGSTIEDLIGLTIECERIVFESKNCPMMTRNSFLLSLVEYSRSSHQNTSPTTAATLLALNFLESAIRNKAGHSAGRAPLLKTMISEIRDPDVRLALQLLLLPSGLNFRNLVWHGFVPELPRHWLAVVVVLAMILQEDGQVKIESSVEMYDLDLKHVDGFESVFLYDVHVAKTTESVLHWLPQSHHPLWYLAIQWYEAKTKPVSTMSILIILLESGLRQMWCRCNDRSDLVAVPNEYFVTLDGFGQRKKQHNIFFHPYLLEEGRSRNKLIEYLPGSTTALITDLFCSPGGPNVRGLVSHGSYGANLLQEWERCNNCDGKTEDLWQTTHAVLVGLYLVASRGEIDYGPVFSNTAVSEQLLKQAQVQLRELRDLQVNCKKYVSVATMSIDDTNTIGVVPESFQVTRLLPQYTIWTADDVFAEHESNVKLANAGAARMLLQDVESATATHKRELQEALNSLEGPRADVAKRKQKRSLRIIEASQAAYSLYRFGMCVAVLHLKEQLTENDNTQSVSIRAVERARMVISTFDNFLHSNTERAMKSLRDYNKAKKTKEIAAVLCHHIFQQDTDTGN